MPRSPCSQCTALGSAAGPRTAQQGSAHLPGTAGRPLSVTAHLPDTPAHTAGRLTPVTALDPEFVELGQVTQERKEQLLPFFGFSKFTQVMQHSLP